MENIENKTVDELITIYKNNNNTAQKLIKERDKLKKELKNRHEN